MGSSVGENAVLPRRQGACFDTELYQQVLGLTAPWGDADVRLDVESTEIHVHVDHPRRLPLELPAL